MNIDTYLLITTFQFFCFSYLYQNEDKKWMGQ